MVSPLLFLSDCLLSSRKMTSAASTPLFMSVWRKDGASVKLREIRALLQLETLRSQAFAFLKTAPTIFKSVRSRTGKTTQELFFLLQEFCSGRSSAVDKKILFRPHLYSTSEHSSTITARVANPGLSVLNSDKDPDIPSESTPDPNPQNLHAWFYSFWLDIILF